jgi:hypothetical protein
MPGIVTHTGVPTAKRLAGLYAFGFGVFMSSLLAILWQGARLLTEWHAVSIIIRNVLSGPEAVAAAPESWFEKNDDAYLQSVATRTARNIATFSLTYIATAFYLSEGRIPQELSGFLTLGKSSRTAS